MTIAKKPDLTVPEEDPQVMADLLRMRDLLAEQDIEGARACIRELAVKWPDSERVQYYARVLAPPVARVVPGKPARPLDRERAWLRAHGHEYPGCWLAIHGDQLIAADPVLKDVLEAVRRRPDLEEPMLFFQGREPGEP